MLFGDGFTFDRDLDRAGKMHTAQDALLMLWQKQNRVLRKFTDSKADFEEKLAAAGKAAAITWACVAQRPGECNSTFQFRGVSRSNRHLYHRTLYIDSKLMRGYRICLSFVSLFWWQITLFFRWFLMNLLVCSNDRFCPKVNLGVGIPSNLSKIISQSPIASYGHKVHDAIYIAMSNNFQSWGFLLISLLVQKFRVFGWWRISIELPNSA